MEPETHRLDREQLLADRRAAAESIQLELDDLVAAAAAKRRGFLEWFLTRRRIEARNESERERLWVDLRLASRATP